MRLISSPPDKLHELSETSDSNQNKVLTAYKTYIRSRGHHVLWRQNWSVQHISTLDSSSSSSFFLPLHLKKVFLLVPSVKCFTFVFTFISKWKVSRKLTQTFYTFSLHKQQLPHEFNLSRTHSCKVTYHCLQTCFTSTYRVMCLCSASCSHIQVLLLTNTY